MAGRLRAGPTSTPSLPRCWSCSFLRAQLRISRRTGGGHESSPSIPQSKSIGNEREQTAISTGSVVGDPDLPIVNLEHPQWSTNMKTLSHWPLFLSASLQHPRRLTGLSALPTKVPDLGSLSSLVEPDAHGGGRTSCTSPCGFLPLRDSKTAAFFPTTGESLWPPSAKRPTLARRR